MKKVVIMFVLFSYDIVISQEESSAELAVETSIGKVGDYTQVVPAAVSLITIFAKEDEQGFWQFTKSMGVNLTATWVLKFAIDKPRPEGRLDAHAFPFWHTSAAFQGDAFLQRRYGWSYGILPASWLRSYFPWGLLTSPLNE